MGQGEDPNANDCPPIKTHTAVNNTFGCIILSAKQSILYSYPLVGKPSLSLRCNTKWASARDFIVEE